MASNPFLSLPNSIFFIFFLFSFAFAISLATVPPSKTFKFINQGEFGEYIVEYDGNYRVLSIISFPFTLCFYNTTPNAFTLALRMGSRHSESTMLWVWEPNRGSPVGENATLTFGRDGNLALADFDGRLVWETGTANKGVVGLRLFSNGNLVLHDKRGGFIWQSFDHPTDTLLVGQALKINGPNKLVSRVSDQDGSEGPYTLILEPKHLAMYVKNKNSPNPLLYYISSDLYVELTGEGSFATVTFNCAPVNDGHAYDLMLDLTVANSSSAPGTSILARPKYNSTLSLLRLGSDGNLKIYTYNDKVDWGAWEVTFTLFSRTGRQSECRLPSRCGSLGVCEDEQCVACPRPQGLLGWSKGCAPPTLPPCKGGGAAANVDYYKVVGVEHFLSQYEEGVEAVKVGACREKCNKDCKCLGFFYKEESSKCLLAPVLDTLVKVENVSHVGFIKVSK